jgi:hypothetical protein
MANNFYVYTHTRADTNQVFYIGKGKGDRSKNVQARGRYWKNVYNKAGGMSVDYIVKDVDEEFAFMVEIECIELYRDLGCKLANITNGGTGAAGRIVSEDTRRRIGLANSKTPKARGESHGMYGKNHTQESLQKMSLARKGKYIGEKHPMFGKSHSADTIAKISKSKQGIGVGKDNPFYGKTHSQETKAKISQAGLGRVCSEEARKNHKTAALNSAEIMKRCKKVTCIDTGIQYDSLSKAAEAMNLHRQCIRMACNGDLKKTGGYKFKWSDK